MEEDNRSNLKALKITSFKGLNEVENTYRITDALNTTEFIPYAENTSYVYLANNVFQDRDIQRGKIERTQDHWMHPLYLIRTIHDIHYDATEIGTKAIEFIKQNPNYRISGSDANLDIMSLSTSIQGEKIILLLLVRYYEKTDFDFTGFFSFLGEKIVTQKQEESEIDKKIKIRGRLTIPDEVANYKRSKEELAVHAQIINEQKELLKNSTKEKPFLNNVGEYIREILPAPSDYIPGIYDLTGFDSQLKIVGDEADFQKVFREVMHFSSTSGTGFYEYLGVLETPRIESKKAIDKYMDSLQTILESEYIGTGLLKKENLAAMMKKLYRSLFQLYIVQDLIDDPDVTDIRIIAPDDISVRVKGKRYLANVSFIDVDDYLRFFTYLYNRNKLDRSYPKQSCVYKFDEDYLLRFTIFAAYTSSNDLPMLHIRKEPRKKLNKDDLLRLGFMTENVANFIIDTARQNGGIAWVGRPGSGKTVGLNWMLEDGYEQEADVLVIQENDEIFTNKRGVMIQHIVELNTEEQQAVDLEDLSKMALVAGANVFIIGETKGAEVCDALTLGISGCRTSTTLHTFSAEEGWYKIANMALKGNYKDYELALEDAIKCFKTMIYCENFSVKEIVQAESYDRVTHKINYRYIYKKE